MRARQHVNPLSLVFETYQGTQVKSEMPLEVEIGCADAQFLFQKAEVDPNKSYIGLEIREKLVDDVNQRAAREKKNVKAIFCNASLHLTTIFEKHSIDRVFINFPDPWFKSRHHKRRMINRELLEQLSKVVKKDGEVFFQSDVWDVALETLELFEEMSHLYKNQAGEWSFWKQGNPYGVRSWREENAANTGLDVWRLMYKTA